MYFDNKNVSPGTLSNTGFNIEQARAGEMVQSIKRKQQDLRLDTQHIKKKIFFKKPLANCACQARDMKIFSAHWSASLV